MDDISRLFADAAAAEEKRGKSERKARVARHGSSGGKNRPPGTDTPRTAKMIYRVLDNTTKTCWFIAGLGTTERMIDILNKGKHDLQRFTEDRHGKSQVPRDYQLSLNLIGKNEPTTFWEPTERFTKCHFIDNGAKLAGLYRVLHDPLIPGKVAVELASTDKHPGVEPTSVGIAGPGKWLYLEWEHLRQQATTGTKVITHELMPDQVLGALEELLDVTMTEAAKQKALAHLAPVKGQEDSYHPAWLNSQDWPEQKVIPRPPTRDEIHEETVYDAWTYPLEDRGLNTKHW